MRSVEKVVMNYREVYYSPLLPKTEANEGCCGRGCRSAPFFLRVLKYMCQSAVVCFYHLFLLLYVIYKRIRGDGMEERHIKLLEKFAVAYNYQFPKTHRIPFPVESRTSRSCPRLSYSSLMTANGEIREFYMTTLRKDKFRITILKKLEFLSPFPLASRSALKRT